MMGSVSARPRSESVKGLYICDFALADRFLYEFRGEAASRSISSKDCGFSHNGEVMDSCRLVTGAGLENCSGELVRGVICPGEFVRGTISPGEFVLAANIGCCSRGGAGRLLFGMVPARLRSWGRGEGDDAFSLSGDGCWALDGLACGVYRVGLRGVGVARLSIERVGSAGVVGLFS